MNSNKKIYLILFATIAYFSLFSMDNPEDQKKFEEQKEERKNTRNISLPQWVKDAGKILIGRSSESTITKIAQEIVFKNFNTDIQTTILDLLRRGSMAQSLPKTAKTITMLSQVNKDLNALINNPQYCLETIKYLSEKFQCSNQQVCLSLQTFQAKKQWKLQKKLLELCEQSNSNEWIFALLCNQGADLYFTYFYNGKIVTPIMIAIINNSNAVEYFMRAGFNINYPTKNGLTALILAAQENKFNAVNLLVQHPTININQPNDNGSTALHLALNSRIPSLQIIQLLLKHGADPIMKNKQGITPLSLAQDMKNPLFFEIIKKDMDEKRKQ